MRECSHCGHVQGAFGASCPRCGGPLLPAADASAAAVDLTLEFEPTRHAAVGDAATSPLEGLEPYGAVTGDVGVERLAEFEPTALPAGVDAPAQALPDFEPTISRLSDPPTTLPAIPTCRYCGNAQPLGALCDVCGMRLPRPPTTKRRDGDGARPLCPGCGVPLAAGRRCGQCGHVPSGDDQ